MKLYIIIICNIIDNFNYCIIVCENNTMVCPTRGQARFVPRVSGFPAGDARITAVHFSGDAYRFVATLADGKNDDESSLDDGKKLKESRAPVAGR